MNSQEIENYIFEDIKRQILENQRRLDILWEMLDKYFPLKDNNYYTLKDGKLVIDYR